MFKPLKNVVWPVICCLRSKVATIFGKQNPQYKKNLALLALALLIFPELLTFVAINLKIRFQEVIYVAEPNVPNELINKGYNGYFITTKIDSYLEELDKTYDFAEETRGHLE